MIIMEMTRVAVTLYASRGSSIAPCGGGQGPIRLLRLNQRYKGRADEITDPSSSSGLHQLANSSELSTKTSSSTMVEFPPAGRCLIKSNAFDSYAGVPGDYDLCGVSQGDIIVRSL
jgi:hypothetical protein